MSGAGRTVLEAAGLSVAYGGNTALALERLEVRAGEGVGVGRPSSAGATERGRGPGAMICQPSRIPAPPATNTAVSSSRPCGVMRPKNRSSFPE